MRIDRCVCTDLTFAELLEQARRAGVGLGDLALCTGATLGCGLCKPYLRETLRTGQTVFTDILVEGESIVDAA